MGNEHSARGTLECVNEDIGYPAIILRKPNRVKILHGNDGTVYDVLERVTKIIYERNWGSSFPDGSIWIDLIPILKLPGDPFSDASNKDSAAVGKIFLCDTIQAMYIAGYDVMLASDLSKHTDQSTIIFKKSEAGRQPCQVCCVAPGGFDRIILVHHNAQVKGAVLEAIEAGWELGVDREKTEVICHEEVVRIKVNGMPWYSSSEESTPTRKLVGAIIEKMANLGWQLLAPINLKGNTDAFFFIHFPEQAIHYYKTAMLSLHRHDRLRLIGFKDEAVIKAIEVGLLETFKIQLTSNEYYGTFEFQFPDSPFHCSGEESVQTRMIFAKIMETLCPLGWFPVTGIDVSRKTSDKSVIAFSRCNPLHVPFACVSLHDDDKIRLISWPTMEKVRLSKVIQKTYMKGVDQFVESGHHGCAEFNLQGDPWEDCKNDGVLGRSMIIHLIKAANELGWKLICSLDLSAKKMERNDGIECPNDVHSLFFCRVSNEELDSAFSPACDGAILPAPGPFVVPPPVLPSELLDSSAEVDIPPPMGWCVPPPPPDYKDPE